MSIINMVKTMKEIHCKDVILIKNGKFYNAYGKDTYIISYLFGYKLKKVENVMMCGFPLSSIHKVMAKLEERKINYLIVDRRNNYEVDERLDNKNLNNYTKYFEKAKKYISYKTRIDNINNFLLENIDKEDFKDIIRKTKNIIKSKIKIIIAETL